MRSGRSGSPRRGTWLSSQRSHRVRGGPADWSRPPVTSVPDDTPVGDVRGWDRIAPRRGLLLPWCGAGERVIRCRPGTTSRASWWGRSTRPAPLDNDDAVRPPVWGAGPTERGTGMSGVELTRPAGDLGVGEPTRNRTPAGCGVGVP